MKALCIDDEKIILDSIVRMVGDNPKIGEATGFSKVTDAIEWLKDNTPDIVFMDISMHQINGLEFAAKIKKDFPDVHIVFITGFSEFAVDAFKVRADGYLMKPVSAEDIDDEISYLERMNDSGRHKNRVFIQTFGNFEVFVDEKPLKFYNHVAKEIFAYLVDKRGAFCSSSELEIITEEYAGTENSRKTMVRQGIASIRQALNNAGVPDVIEKKYNGVRVVKENFDCDYYRFLDGDIQALNAFTGEYMTNYSWAEDTCGWMYGRRK